MTHQLLAARNHHCNRRRGVVAVLVAVLLTALLGFAALTVDVGMIYNARADLQRSADAAALAGASAYTTDDMMRVRTEVGGTTALAQVVAYAEERSSQFAGVNPSIGLATTFVEPADILTGWLNLSSASERIHTNPQPTSYNGVEVTVRREASDSDNANGAVPFSLAAIFGTSFGETSASATAVFDDRFAGFKVSDNGASLLPFTIHEDAFYSELVAGGDSYGFDEASGSVTNGSDDIREVRLYPYPLSGAGYTEGDGNFGALNVGTGNQGADAEVDQILNGIPPGDLVAEIGTSNLTFFDQGGAPVTYDITGSPGLEASLKDPINTIIGQVVGFFLHNNVVLSGSNAVYTISQLRFGRVMDIRLTGPPNQRGLFIQPVSFTGSGVVIDRDAPSSNGLVGRLVLAR